MKAQDKISLNRRTKRNYNKRRRLVIQKFMLFVSIALFVFAGSLLIRYAIHAASAKKLQQETKEIYSEAAVSLANTVIPMQQNTTPNYISLTTESTSYLAENTLTPTVTPMLAMGIQFIELYSKNRDLAGWLKADAVPQIDFPVVQRDNEYYLNRDFYGRVQQSGTVFLDESVSIRPKSANIILHGHNMKNGSMFGKLYLYLNPGIIRSNPLFEFSTLYESSIYIPYAISIVSLDPDSAEYVSLLHANFDPDDDLASYTRELQKHSVMQLPVSIQAEDKLLTLITCHGKEEYERLVVGLREVRAEENLDNIKLMYANNTLMLKP